MIAYETTSTFGFKYVVLSNLASVLRRVKMSQESTFFVWYIRHLVYIPQDYVGSFPLQRAHLCPWTVCVSRLSTPWPTLWPDLTSQWFLAGRELLRSSFQLAVLHGVPVKYQEDGSMEYGKKLVVAESRNLWLQNRCPSIGFYGKLQNLYIYIYRKKIHQPLLVQLFAERSGRMRTSPRWTPATWMKLEPMALASRRDGCIILWKETSWKKRHGYLMMFHGKTGCEIRCKQKSTNFLPLHWDYV